MSNCKIGNQASDNEVYLRDISAQEVCHLLMGYLLLKSSRKIILLNLSEMNMLSSTIKRRQGDNNGESVGTDSSFVARYMTHPLNYENTSLVPMAKKHYFNRDRCITQKRM